MMLVHVSSKKMCPPEKQQHGTKFTCIEIRNKVTVVRKVMGKKKFFGDLMISPSLNWLVSPPSFQVTYLGLDFHLKKTKVSLLKQLVE